MLGILLVDKPLHLTSHDVVNRLRRKLGTKRVGHAGTLDPLATGLLVVAVGPATRFLQYLPLEPKVYEAQIKFGIETTTQDAEGEVVRELPVPKDLKAQIEKHLPDFQGLIEQLPPIYSAVKKDGKPLYHYARKGLEVERTPRRVHITSAEFEEIDLNTAEVRIVCSGGTYIRTWAHDLGQAIGCGAHLSGLIRTNVGSFDLANACDLDEVTTADLIPLSTALEPAVPLVPMNAVETKYLREGQSVGAGRKVYENIVALVAEDGNVFGMARYENDRFFPECVIPLEATLTNL